MFDKEMLLVIIDGIDNDFEAWQLIRLFFDEESIVYAKDYYKLINTCDNASIIAVSADDKENWSCTVNYYSSIPLKQLKNILSDNYKGLGCGITEIQDEIDKTFLIKTLEEHYKPQYSSCETVDLKELDQPGGSLLKSKKIIIGTCIYNVLSMIKNKKLPYGSLTGVRPVKLAMQCLKDGMDKSSTIRQLTRVTGMNENKAGLIYDVAKAEEPYMNKDKSIMHIYIGIPFCPSRCLYCSFTSYPVKPFEHIISDYLKTLEKEIDYVSEWVNKKNIRIGSVYMGGGTPTSIDAFGLDRLLKHINSRFDISNSEFTVEAGRPDSITLEKLEIIKNNKVTRISINPQTMNQETLIQIGRNHTPEDIEEKFYMARKMGFDNINMDIIAGLPKEDEQMFMKTLLRIEAMSPESITVHTMAVKRASRLNEFLDEFLLTSDKVVETMIEDARASAIRMKMKPYYLYRQKNILANLENTGYAKAGCECIYNIHTMEENQSVLALGAGAISKFVFPDIDKIERIYNVKEVSHYIGRIDEMLERKRAMFEAYISKNNGR